MKSNIELIMEIVHLKHEHKISDSDLLDTFMAYADNELLNDIVEFIKSEVEDGYLE